jgi:single-stranded-DNA-specific exonuclease
MQQAGMLKRWTWRDATDPAGGDQPPLEAQARQWGLAPIVTQLLRSRGATNQAEAEAFLWPKLSHLQSPEQLPNIEAAAGRLARAVDAGRPIVVYGDYDVDGVTASAILWHVLGLAGANVQTYVPHRIDEGYGLNRDALSELAKLGDANQPPLVVSVDCGISATDEAAHARELGLELIITDHHHFDPEALPDAAELVHPRLGLPEDSSEGDAEASAGSPTAAPCPHLCGAGVAFKLAWQFAKVHCQSERLPETFKQLLMDLLSYVALGTVADVVPLIEENRVLTIFGLGRVKQTRFAGLNAMIDAARLRDEKIDAYHVGFVLGPRLNACGRMGHAREAVRLMTTDDENEARELASFLTKENDRRRSTEKEIFQEAKQRVTEAGYDATDHRAIVLADERWHPGVIGIVASRLVDAFARPVVMLSCDNGKAKGSARSVDGLHIHQAFTACQQHLSGFGGHAMAAGLSLPTEEIDAFRQALVQYVNRYLGPEDLVGVLQVDGTIDLNRCGLQLFDQLARLAPFGRGNPTPHLMLENVQLDRDAERVGQQGKHLSLLLKQGGTRLKAIGFQMGDYAEQLPAGVTLDVVFEPKVNTFRGTRRPEIHVLDFQFAAQADAQAENEKDRGLQSVG